MLLFSSSVKIKCKMEYKKKANKYKSPKGKTSCPGSNLSRVPAVKMARMLAYGEMRGFL